VSVRKEIVLPSREFDHEKTPLFKFWGLRQCWITNGVFEGKDSKGSLVNYNAKKAVEESYH
jgi:hypothetical protein